MYWRAIKSELADGCSCVSFDESRHMHRHICVCANSGVPPQNGARSAVPCEEQLPIKVPSRVAPLIEELREVICAVVMPPPPPIRIRTCGSGSHTPSSPTQPRRMTASDEAEVAWLREAFDVPLIEQQLRHGVFNPAKLLIAIGNLLREHCAPARDHLVDTIVEIAKRCSTRTEATLIDALQAIRLCFDLLELMRLVCVFVVPIGGLQYELINLIYFQDLANHLLAQLRPYLLASAPSFEISIFERRPNPTDSITRAWIANSYTKLISSSDLHTSVGAVLPPPERIRSLPSGLKVVATVLSALVDLVVFPPNPISAILPPSPTTTPVTKGRQTYHVNVQAEYPETLYLDHSRLLMLTADAADITANAMFLALFRQLVFSESMKRGKRVSIQDDELSRLKSEINAVGPQRPGVCFCREYSQSDVVEAQAYEPSIAVWRETMASAALQLAHAVDKTASRDGKEDDSTAARFAPPDSELLASVTSWCKTYMNATSDVAKVFRKKVAAEMLRALIPRFFAQYYVMGAQRRPSNNNTSQAATMPFATAPDNVMSTTTDCEMADAMGMDANATAAAAAAPKPKTGLEPLSEEIRLLVERLAKLAALHLRVYMPLYDLGGFVEPDASDK